MWEATTGVSCCILDVSCLPLLCACWPATNDAWWQQSGKWGRHASCIRPHGHLGHVAVHYVAICMCLCAGASNEVQNYFIFISDFKSLRTLDSSLNSPYIRTSDSQPVSLVFQARRATSEEMSSNMSQTLRGTLTPASDEMFAEFNSFSAGRMHQESDAYACLMRFKVRQIQTLACVRTPLASQRNYA
jgi:hypothetical protein